MDIKIRQEDYNALLGRKEIHAEVDHHEKGTPSRTDVRKAIAEKYSTKPENVYVIDVNTKTGTQSAFCEVEVYDDPKVARKTVAKHLQIRILPPEERKRVREQEAKKQEAKPKAEKPKEEKVKAETKPAPEAAKKEEKGKAETKATAEGAKKESQSK